MYRLHLKNFIVLLIYLIIILYKIKSLDSNTIKTFIFSLHLFYIFITFLNFCQKSTVPDTIVITLPKVSYTNGRIIIYEFYVYSCIFI